ncbi:MAG: sigma-70 family RNA polymerase sigma factor [Ruminococcaceae bacterium]|nr:sigma-70 family RNA polymerase sigma factor [Oscillospiraceae bacterium]
MYFNKVEICGIDTSTLKVIPEKEKNILLEKAKNGDSFAREKLVTGNLRLVLSVIQRFANRGENLDDLFQVGCIGLLKAIDNFDTSHDVRFSTYAVPMIGGNSKFLLMNTKTLEIIRVLAFLLFSHIAFQP